MPFGMGYGELLLILVVVLLLFGAKRIPEMAQGLGKGIKEFKTAMRDVKDEIDLNAPSETPQNTIHPSTPSEAVAQQPASPPREETKEVKSETQQQ
jgi:sec-independent protein translocase protein TatA